jgi:hypothetical protein
MRDKLDHEIKVLFMIRVTRPKHHRKRPRPENIEDLVVLHLRRSRSSSSSTNDM